MGLTKEEAAQDPGCEGRRRARRHKKKVPQARAQAASRQEPRRPRATQKFQRDRRGPQVTHGSQLCGADETEELKSEEELKREMEVMYGVSPQ